MTLIDEATLRTCDEDGYYDYGDAGEERYWHCEELATNFCRTCGGFFCPDHADDHAITDHNTLEENPEGFIK